MKKGEGYEVFHEKNVVCEWVKAITLPYINTLCASRIYIICVYHAYIYKGKENQAVQIGLQVDFAAAKLLKN